MRVQLEEDGGEEIPGRRDEEVRDENRGEIDEAPAKAPEEV